MMLEVGFQYLVPPLSIHPSRQKLRRGLMKWSGETGKLINSNRKSGIGANRRRQRTMIQRARLWICEPKKVEKQQEK